MKLCDAKVFLRGIIDFDAKKGKLQVESNTWVLWFLMVVHHYQLNTMAPVYVYLSLNVCCEIFGNNFNFQDKNRRIRDCKYSNI